MNTHRIRDHILRRLGCEGQTLVEYALILLLVALVVVATVGVLGNTLVNTYYNQVIGAFTGT